MSFLLLLTLLMATPSAQLHQDWVLGVDDPDIYFGMGARLAVAENGTLYVLDPGRHTITAFDTEGKPKFSFGSKGNGPGEFVEPGALAISPGGELVVFDTSLKRRIVFDPAGNYQRDAFFEAGIVAIREAVALDQDYSALVTAKLDKEGRPIYDLSLYDPQMKPVKSLQRLTVKPLDWSKSNNSAFWVTFLAQQFELLGKAMPMVTGVGKGRLAATRITRYQLALFDMRGEKIGSAPRDIKPLFFNEATREAAFKTVWHNLAAENFLTDKLKRPVFEKAKKAAELPPVLPVVHRMAKTDTGFAVLYNYHPLKRAGILAFHDAAGKVTGEVPFEGPAEFIAVRGDKVYSVGENAEGDIVVTRFSLINGTI
ncbi:6-bladed beta-propeller [Acanthopleuribacter pedis]|uniref:6-bladed beta-propeller n=1 Tax=Acanthopleuribacter pedis TaxID=442870 RepID=A0A8J7U4E7_9BACT|nr:6-bladed beta-propeller [Acanthopleuribacter pedis]MBO1319724.1 hypothetical protein [Acanthopleuribacter pedis]